MKINVTEIQLLQASSCANDEHEIENYPRPSFKPKPEILAGTRLRVKEEWQNFYGRYYRCYLPDEMKDKGYSIPWYDIPVDKKAIVIG